MNKNNNGFVYAFTNPLYPELVKIGKTLNIKKRLTSLSSSSPQKFVCSYFLKVEDMHTVEKAVHIKLKNKRVKKTEFFNVSIEEAKETILSCSENKKEIERYKKTFINYLNGKINTEKYSNKEKAIITKFNSNVFFKKNLKKTLFDNKRYYKIIKDWYLFIPSGTLDVKNYFSENFYNFSSQYLEKYYKNKYIVSPQNTIDFIINETEVKKQIIVHLEKPINNQLILDNGYAVFLLHGKNDLSKMTKNIINGMQCYTLSNAILATLKNLCVTQPENAELALKMVKNPEDYFTDLSGEYSRQLGRVIRAYEHIGMKNFAQRLEGLASGFKIKPVYENPFKQTYVSTLSLQKYFNPAAIRIKKKWEEYVKIIQENIDLSDIPINHNLENLVDNIQQDFLKDDYNSLSIECYRITPEIIEA